MLPPSKQPGKAICAKPPSRPPRLAPQFSEDRLMHIPQAETPQPLDEAFEPAHRGALGERGPAQLTVPSATEGAGSDRFTVTAVARHLRLFRRKPIYPPSASINYDAALEAGTCHHRRPMGHVLKSLTIIHLYDRPAMGSSSGASAVWWRGNSNYPLALRCRDAPGVGATLARWRYPLWRWCHDRVTAA